MNREEVTAPPKKALQALLVFAIIFAGTQWATSSGMYCNDLTASVHRPHSVSITEFGAVGDGVTLNTKAFRNAIFYLSSFADKGGAELFVPAGRIHLTGQLLILCHLMGVVLMAPLMAKEKFGGTGFTITH
ncbi:hypothetical protein E2562_004447 [Oryza meyeriana var. granulata]|uniref:Uncharacterized protein n=1 Tax=Oryza meyeriana var. granulata TaxID=110450 RepID=A0A6G1CZD5_9ORYZ|nr:hypothetical protein E2562_004447 [Oryza meyeriana var. granulata]